MCQSRRRAVHAACPPADAGARREAGRSALLHALATATRFRAAENGRWRVCGGLDEDGDPLDAVVAMIAAGVLVITVVGD